MSESTIIPQSSLNLVFNTDHNRVWRTIDLLRNAYYMTAAPSSIRESNIVNGKNGEKYAVYARQYNSKRGIGIEVRYHPGSDDPLDGSVCDNSKNPGHYTFAIYMRRSSGKYIEATVPGLSDEASIEKVITIANDLRGDTIQRKKRKRDPKAEKLMRVRKPSTVLMEKGIGGSIRWTNTIKRAICEGFCTIDENFARVSKIVDDPNIKNVYFFLDVIDYYNRSFVVLLKDTNEFMIAVQHNPKCIKITDHDCLFVTGNNPLRLININTNDMLLLQQAIKILTI